MRKYKYHPYKIHLVQRLTEDDFDRRIEFCQWAVEQLDLDRFFTIKIVSSDEAIFYLNGHVNRHNMRYWSDCNPHWSYDTNFQGGERVMVWCGIIGNRIIGPFFFDNHVNASTYLDLLRNKLWSNIVLMVNSGQLYFQQDGAQAHYAKSVRDWLDENLANRWIGRRGSVEWPPRSPDLSPLDFFLWGYLKSKVHNDRPRTLEDLKINIINACKSVTPEMLTNVREAWEMRIKHCITADGEQFEHMI